MHRIVVIGNPGSGKTTVAKSLAEKLEFPVLELDSIYHQAGWEPLPEEEFRMRVADFALQTSWVIDGNYTGLGIDQLIWPVADTIIWLDLDRPIVMWRIIKRTLKRWLTREELWNTNREPLSGPFRLDPERSIIRWAWTKHPYYRERYEEALAGPEAVHLKVFRLRTAEEVESFLRSVSRT